MQLQLGSDDNDRATRIVDAFTKQVLPETPLLSFQHVGEGFESAVVIRTDCVHAARVVEQRIHRLLQHPLLVPQDNIRRFDVNQALQAIVANDDAPIEIVEVRCCEPSAFQRHQRTKLRRNYRNHIHHHPFRLIGRPIFRFAKGFHHAQALERFLFLQHRCLFHDLRAQLRCKRGNIHLLQQHLDCLAADGGNELSLVRILQLIMILRKRRERFVVLFLRQQILFL